MLHYKNRRYNANSDISHTKSVLVIGGGFVAIRCILDLIQQNTSVSITLVSINSFFEYYPGMYRVATGSSPMQVCISFCNIFKDMPVKVITDKIISFDPAKRTAIGLSNTTYTADYIILATGSQNNYFNIEGVIDTSYSLESVREAFRLKQHIIDMFEKHTHSEVEETLLALHFVIVGGGPAGVELAGELASYTHRLADEYKIIESLITIDIVERNPRLLMQLPERVSKKVESRIRSLGVNLFLNRTLIRDDSWTVYLKDMKMGAKTLIWTAGVRPSELSQNIKGFEYQKNGRIIVDQYLQAKGHKNIFIAGDIADTQYSGLAQTALYDGAYLACIIDSDMAKYERPIYKPNKNAFNIPVGPGWAVLFIHNILISGRLAWFMRHIIDFRFLLSILPFYQAWRVFWGKEKNTVIN